MRLSTDDDRDEARALETIAAAAGAGIAVYDTAHAYGRGEGELGHNERLLARGLRAVGLEAGARIVTKGGMSRAGGGWVPDGRARTIRADCEASLASLDGLPIDLYLVHAPDPRTPWPTTVRALAHVVEERLVRRVGVSNVNRRQLDEALELAPITAVQVALSAYEDRALRGGVVERCDEAGIALLAHSPLGGPRRASRLTRRGELTDLATRHAATPAELALAWLLDLSPTVVAIPGARRPETARSAARAATLTLGADDRALLMEALGRRPMGRRTAARKRADTTVVLVMGIPGAGKSRVASEYVERGYARLNRDERGGSLRELAGALDELLASGEPRIILDNTYLTRASRADVLDVAARHGTRAECIWLDTPLAQAQVNMVERLLDRFGRLPNPEELKEYGRGEPGLLAPTRQMRALRELEPPSADEGYASVEVVSFARAPSPLTRGGVLVAASALRAPGWEAAVGRCDPDTPHLVFDWSPDGTTDVLADVAARLATVVSGPVETAICPHSGGPPICWCRPPLPGLALAFARGQGIDPARSVLLGTSAAHRTIATTLGARFVEA